jgi:hypothetical protein
LRPPLSVVPTIRCLIRIDEADQYLGHDSSTNWAETMTTCTDISFAENVVPQRGLAMPTGGSDADLLCG